MDNREFFPAMARLHKGFMVPDTYKMDQAEAAEYLDDPDADAGWYCRLSAPGYLDCTEWSGPFTTEREAEEYLVEMYDDGEEE